MISLDNIDKIIAKIEGLLIVFSLFFLISFSFLQIVLRSLYIYANLKWANNLLGQIDWTESFTRLLVLWLTFVGASLLTRDQRHIQIDILPSILPKGLLRIRDLVISMAAVAILVIMIIASMDFIKTEMTFGSTLFLNIPSWIGEIIIPIGFILILLRFLMQIIRILFLYARGSRT